jgi:hypothetical protein
MIVIKNKRAEHYQAVKKRMENIGMSKSCLNELEKICGESTETLQIDFKRWNKFYGYGK